MLGSEGKPPAAVMMAQIIHDTTIARITCVTKHAKRSEWKSDGDKM